MINFRFKLSKWLELSGNGLKGWHLAMILVFLTLVIGLLSAGVVGIGLPKVLAFF